MKRLSVRMPLSEDAQLQAATTPTQMWPTEKMEECGEKKPQKCGNGGT